MSVDWTTIYDGTFALWPPSVNNMFAHFNGRRIASKEYRLFKQAASEDLQVLPDMSHAPHDHYGLEVGFCASDWYTAKGLLWSKKDASNRYKAIEDAVFEALGVDDSRNVAGKFYKLPVKEGRKVIIVIKHLATQEAPEWPEFKAYREKMELTV